MDAHEAQKVIFILYGIYNAVLWPGLLLFILRRNHEPIRSRGWALCVVQALGTFLCLTLYVPGPFDTSCACFLIGYVSIIPISCFPYMGRARLLVENCLRQHSMFEESRVKKYFFDDYILKTSSVRGQLIFFAMYSIASLLIGVLLFFFDKFQSPARIAPENPQDYYFMNCYTTAAVPIGVSESIVVVIVALFWILMMIRTSETFYLRLEFALVLVTGGSFVLVILFLIYFPQSPLLQQPFLTFICYTLFVVYSFWMPIIFSYQREHFLVKKKRNSSIISLAKEDFSIILEDKELAESFERYAIDSWSVENFLFYRDAIKFRTNSSSDSLPQEAKRIWETYFVQDAQCELNIDEKLKEEVMEQMQAQSFSRTMFMEVEKTIASLLWFSMMPLWINSGYVPKDRIIQLKSSRDTSRRDP